MPTTMGPTTSPALSRRDVERARRWLDRTHQFSYVPAAPFDLLMRRLAARRRVAVSCLPLVAIAVGLMVLGDRATARDLGQAGWSRAQAPWLLAAYGVLAVAALVVGKLTASADERVAATLVHRVSRGSATSLRMALGPARAWTLVAIIGCEAVTAVWLVTAVQGWVTWTFLGAFFLAGAFAVTGVRQAVRRATVAIDAVSLTIDELLRSQEAYGAAAPLYLLAFTVPFIALPDDRVFPVASFLPVVVAVLWLIGLSRRPDLAPSGPTTSPPPIGALP